MNFSMESNRYTSIAIGAAVTVFASFIPFSPVLGGGVAGWLSGTDTTNGAKIGAISGGVASLVAVPFVLLAALIFSIGEMLLMLVIVFIITLSTIAFSALGGYLGVLLKQR